jgi:hypothetical protein
MLQPEKKNKSVGQPARLLRILFLMQLFSLASYAQDRSLVRGETQDCFAAHQGQDETSYSKQKSPALLRAGLFAFAPRRVCLDGES